MYARAYYYVSNECHPQQVIHMQKHIITVTLVHVTHSEWHVCTSTLLSLRCVPPTASGIHARAHHYVSCIYHPRRLTYMQEHTTKLPMYTTHGEWHTCKSISISWLQYVPPMTNGIYAKAYHQISNICHPRQVTYMQERTTKPLVRVTHGMCAWASY